MRISKAQVDAYNARIARAQQKARRYAEIIMRAHLATNPDLTEEDMVEIAGELLDQAYHVYGDEAAKEGQRLYDATMEKLQNGAAPAQDVDGYDADRASELVQRAGEEHGFFSDDFIGAVADAAHMAPRVRANRTVMSNAQRDYSRGVRYARVPTGRETCGFCLMLASRGFVYRSEETAGDVGGMFNRYHTRCDCAVLASDEAGSVEGYDPDWLLDVYLDARDAVYGGSGPYDYNETCKEIERRSREWAWHGKAPAPAYEVEPTDAQRRVAQALSEHGFKTTVKKPSTGGLDSGIRMNGRIWRVVESEIEDASDALRAVSGGGRVVLDATTATEDGFKDIVSAVRGSGVEEAIILGPGGRMRRIK